MPGAIKVPNTNFYRAPEHGDDLEQFGVWAANRIEEMIEFEGPDTVAAVILEPMQNAGGCLGPPEGYFQRVREICDEFDVHLIADPLYGYTRITVPQRPGEVAEADIIDNPWVQRLKRIHQLQSSW